MVPIPTLPFSSMMTRSVPAVVKVMLASSEVLTFVVPLTIWLRFRPSTALAGMLVRPEPSPKKVLAVMLPVAERLPVMEVSFAAKVVRLVAPVTLRPVSVPTLVMLG